MKTGIVSIDFKDNKEGSVYLEGIAYLSNNEEYEEFSFVSKLSKSHSYIDMSYKADIDLKLLSKETLSDQSIQISLLNELNDRVCDE